MSEDIDKHVLRKYHVGQKLGKGVSLLPLISSLSYHFCFNEMDVIRITKNEADVLWN